MKRRNAYAMIRKLRANAWGNASGSGENYRAKGILCDKILDVEQIWNSVIR